MRRELGAATATALMTVAQAAIARTANVGALVLGLTRATAAVAVAIGPDATQAIPIARSVLGRRGGRGRIR